MRAAILVGLALAAAVLVWSSWLPVLLSFSVAGLMVGCLESDRIVAWIDDEPYMSPRAKLLMAELRRRAELADRLMDQERDYQVTRRQMTEAARQFRGIRSRSWL